MERTDFTNISTTWWLNAEAPDLSIVELRKDISDHLGWGREFVWYGDERRLDDLYTVIEQGDRDVLHRLDQAIDQSSQIAWLQEVDDLVDPKQSSGESLRDASQAGGAHPADGEKSPADPVEEPITAAAPTATPSPPAKASPFGGGSITADLQPAVDDLAAVVANVVAEVPGAEELSAEEIADLIAEVLAGR